MPTKPKPKQQADLSQIVAPPPSEVSAAPTKEFELEVAIAERDRAEIENDDLRQNISERKVYANRSFWLVVIWLLFIAAVILMQGLKHWGFELSNSIMITLIGSTTGSVVGIFLIVSRYLFKTK